MTEMQTQFYVHGMSDDDIVTANAALTTLPGFVGAEFDLATGVAVVVGDIDPQAVCQVLGEMGCPAVVKSV